MRLKAQLPKLLDVILVNNSYCNHLDFLASLKVNEHINDPVKKILQTTDSVDWKYSGPNPEMDNIIRDTEFRWNTTAVKLQPPSPINHHNFTGDLDDFRKNLDAVVTSVMPRRINKRDVEDFERERKQQTSLLRNTINFFRLIIKNSADKLETSTKKSDPILNEGVDSLH